MQNEYLEINEEQGLVVSYTINYPAHRALKKGPVRKELSREDVEFLFNAFPTAGLNMSHTELCRQMGLTDYELRVIRRVFELSKSSVPVAPHLFKELVSDEIVDYLINIKSDRIQRKVSKEGNDRQNKVIEKLSRENLKLQNLNDDILDAIKNLKLSDFECLPIHTEYKRTFVLWLSDMHIGAMNDASATPFPGDTYSMNELRRRLEKVLNFIHKHNDDFDEIVVMNLGDAIDGINHTTSRCEGKFLPQNMSNKEMIHNYISVVIDLFRNLSTMKKPMTFISVGESNHGGEVEYAATLAISEILKHNHVSTHVATNSIEHLELGDNIIIYMHGKDSHNQFKPFPNTINDKTANYINEYIIHNDLQDSYKNIMVVKGDQHRPAFTNTNTFDYKAVSSLYGSSDWIKSNFGNTKWGCDFSIFEGTNRIDGTIKD